MSNDNDQEALNQNAGEDISVSESPAEETTTTAEAEAAVEEVESTDEATEAQAYEDAGETQNKKGAQHRIRELNDRAKQAESKARSLQEQVQELTKTADQPIENQQRFLGQPDGQQGPPPLFRPGEEVDYSEYERRQTERDNWILRQASTMVELKTKQSEAVNRINSEAKEAMALFPELDPDNDAFDEELSETVSEATLSHIKSNPYSASPKQFISKLMKPYKRSLTKQVGKASENIAKQVSQAASRPTSVTKKDKDYQDKSLEELEQELGIIY